MRFFYLLATAVITRSVAGFNIFLKGDNVYQYGEYVEINTQENCNNRGWDDTQEKFTWSNGKCTYKEHPVYKLKANDNKVHSFLHWNHNTCREGCWHVKSNYGRNGELNWGFYFSFKQQPEGLKATLSNANTLFSCYLNRWYFSSTSCSFIKGSIVDSTTTITTTTAMTTTTTEAKSACGLTEWDLSKGELTGTSVTLGTSGGASAAVTITTAHQFAKCTVSGDFKFTLYEVDSVNTICSTTAVAAGLWTTKKVFEPTPGTNAATTTARVDIAFSTTALAADLQKAKPQIYRKGNTAGTEVLSFCVRSAIKVDDYELRFSEMIVTATINTVLAIPAIENVAVTRPEAKVATTGVDVLGTINAYECYKDGNTFKGWLPGASKPALTTQNNILSVCVTGVSTAVECKEFWDLSLKQGSKAGDVRVDDGANKKRLITSVFGVQAIKDTNQVDYKGCAAQLLLDASYFDSAKPEKVTLSGSVRMGLAARRRLLRDSRSLSEDTETADFDVDVDRLQGSTSGVTMKSLATTVLVSAAAVCIM